VRVAIVSLILFLSGCSALIFQTLWLRLSGLVFGNSVWAAALILSSFMAGLALGSAIAASSKSRRLRPLHLYAGLEIAVALLGCTLVFGLPLLGEWLRPVFQILWDHQAMLNVLRFSLSLVILVVPTTAMGLTLPVLLEDPILRRHEFGRTIGLLYGANTLGAVLGALLGENYLVRAGGLLGTGLTAGFVGGAAAGIAWLLSATDRVAVGRTEKSPVPLRPSAEQRLPWRLLFVSMGAGASLLCLEVVWFRFLRLYIASSPTAFSVMLAVVLLGIGMGGIVSVLIPQRIAPSRQLLPILLMLAAIAALLSYLFFPVTFPASRTVAFLESWQQIARLSLALMFPVSFLSGILFPTIVTCVQAKVGNRMNSAGLTILFNTAGAATGPLLAAFLLLPYLGFQSSLVLCAVMYAGLAVLASERGNWSLQRSFGLTVIALCAILALILALFPYRRDEMHFADAIHPYQADGSRVLKKIEGTSDTLQLLRRDLFGKPYYYRLVTNAYSMSGTLPRSQRYMRLFAYLPLALHPESENALLLCHGVGVTADAFIRDAHLKQIDIVDISKEVFDLASSFTGPGYSNPLRDPRATTFVQDARFFLQASPDRYDIITGEPPPLKVAGTVNLYTQQFFALMRDRLKDGGIASFWLPIYQLTTDETKAILRGFHNVFPNASVWATSDLEWIMMGFKSPLRKVTEQEVRRLWNNAATGPDLMRIGIEVPEQMAALFLMDGEEIDRITQGIEPLTDFYPKRLSDAPPDLAATARFAYTYMERSAAARRFSSSSLVEKVWPEQLKTSLEPLFFVRETRYRSQLSGSNWLEELDFYLRHTQLRTPVLELLNSDEFRLALAQELATSSPNLPAEALPDLVAGMLARRDLRGAIQLLESETSGGFANINDFFLLTYLYCLNGEVEKAEALAARNQSIQKDWFVDWLWGDLQAEFGFRPPR
jgi:predicted membrane-bound spermidine synthase